MAKTISQLSVDFQLSSAKFTSEMEKARKSIGGLRGDLQLIRFDSIVNLGERAFRAGQQIYNLMESTSALGSEIQRNARTLDMSTQEYQKWLYVAKAADVEAEQFMMGLRVLTKNLGDFSRGTGESKDAFQRLGLSSKDAFKSMSELLPEIIKKLSEVKNVGEQNALTMDIFGSRSGLAIANMVREGKNIDEIIQRFKELGGGIDDVSLKKLADAEQSFKDFNLVMQKVKAEALAPAVSVFAELLKAIIDLKHALLDNDWEALWKRMSPAGAGEAQKGGVGSMYMEYERSLKDKAASMYGGIGTGEIKGKGGGGGETRDVFGMTEADHARSKNNLEWYKNWVTDEFVPSLSSISMGEGAAAEGIITKWVKDDIKQAEDEYKNYVKDQLSDPHRYDQMIRGAKEAEMLYGLHESAGQMEKDTKFMENVFQQFSSNMRISWNVNLIKMLSDGDSFADGVKQIFKSIGDSFISTIQKMITNWLLWGSIQGDTGKGKGWGTEGQSGYGGIIGSLGSLVGSFQHGTDYVSQTGLALVHQGEAVIPAEGNKGKQGGDTYIFVEATDLGSFERKYGSVIDSRVIAGKRYNRVGMRG